MAYLIGFRATKKAQGSKADENNVVDLVLKSYLNRTAYGDFSTTEEVDGAIQTMQKLPQTLYVQEKIADLQNKKLQISSKLNDMLMDKNVFDMDLAEAATNATKNNIQNPKALIGTMAAIYGDAVERYENDIYSNIFKRYGTTDKIPAEVMDYRKQLQDKAKLYANVFNSYNFIDEKTGEVGMLNPDAFGVVVDTNPATGKISRIEIVPSGEIKKDQYMRTDTPLQVIEGMPGKKLPIYLRTFDAGMSEFGKPIRSAVLGGFVYSGVDTKNKTDDAGNLGVGSLSLQKEGDGFLEGVGRAVVPKWFGWEENVFGRSQGDVAESLKTNGVNLKQFEYDSADIPNNSVLRMGNRIFYSTKNNNEIFEITGKDENAKMTNLNKLITENGENPKIVNTPYFIDRSYLTAPDGSSRIKTKVDDKYFSPEVASVAPVNPARSITSSMASSSPMPSPAPEVTKSSFFAEKANSTPAMVKPQESSGGKSFVGDIIDKGKSFFKKADSSNGGGSR